MYAFIYATDGAWILDRAFRNLKGVNLDVVILDATCGDYLDEHRLAKHNSISMLRVLVPFMRVTGLSTKDRTFI